MDMRDPKAAWMILGGLLAVVVLYLNFGTSMIPFSYRGRMQEAGELQQRYEALALENRRARAAAARLPQLETQAERLERHWAEAQRLIPKEKEIDLLLREISFRGQSSGVDFLLFRPMKPVAYDYHTEHPIEVRVEGSFHEITGLLRELASMRRIVNVRDLLLEQNPSEEEDAGSAKAHFTAVAYTLGGTPGAASAGTSSAIRGGAPGEGAAPPTQATQARPGFGRNQE
ncbi:MAG: type 4a pilus biogenesis protein PilO [Candidatus Eisenbacteria bacterium]|nr:type 4a pilus biogenesis protein PilO [Candidatus Eisenbacteria bacterium]